MISAAEFLKWLEVYNVASGGNAASGTVDDGLINELGLYAASGDTVSGLATANNGLLVTSAAGVPSIGNDILADITVNGLTVGRGNFDNLSNTALGNLALSSASSGGTCVAIGSLAMSSAPSPSNSIGIGYRAQIGASGDHNVTMGRSAGESLSGDGSTLIGGKTGFTGATGAVALVAGGSCSVFGYQAGVDSATAIGCLSLGRDAVSLKATGATSGDAGPGIAIGSAAFPVGFRGDATIYPGNFARARWNGTHYMLPLQTDGATSIAVTSGGTGLASTTTNQLLYSSATSTIAGLATANSGTLVTSAAGVPSISSTLPSTVQNNITELGVIATLTAGVYTSTADLQLTPNAGNELDINLSSLSHMGVQVRSAEATGNPRLLFYRANTVNLGGVYAGQNDTLSGTGENLFIRNSRATGKIILSDATGSAVTVSGGDTTLSGSLTTSQTAGIIGTTTNNNADAGSVGEYVTATKATGVSVSLTTNTAVDILTISLTAGDWEVWGNGAFTQAATTEIAYFSCWVSSSSASLPGAENLSRISYDVSGGPALGGAVSGLAIASKRFSLSSTTTIYLSSRVGFTVDTANGYGSMYARRVR